jgi:TonB-dependent receptor
MFQAPRRRSGLHSYLATTALVALATTTTAYAQQAPAATAPAAAPGDAPAEVVVTGQRAALKSAIQVKKNSEVIVDSISADDAGKLPDNSVTEVLQRIVGVNISRIQTGAGQGSENYLGEGTGVTIRGLDAVSLLNGRDSFSSVNGRGLAWEDIPPELMQGVDAYKSAEADLPEGGLGGIINLRTRQPFDYRKLTVSGAIEGNYGDYSNKAHPGGNLMVSNRWDTPIGEIGLLLNAAYSDLTTRADGVQVQPYFAEVYDPAVTSPQQGCCGGQKLPYTGSPGAQQVYVPYGADFSSGTSDRKRLGLYAAAQWKPNNDLTLGLTVFRSQYKLSQLSNFLMVDDSSDTVIAPGATATFDKNGFLTSTTGLSGYAYAQPGSLTAGPSGGNGSGWSYVNNPYDFQTQASNSKNVTTDYSFTAAWKPNSQLSVNFAVQHVDSSAVETDLYAYDYAFLPPVGLTLSPYGNSAPPRLSFPSGIDLSNPANYGYLATMDHRTSDHGHETAVYADAIYRLPGDGFIQAIKFGFKITGRDENDLNTPYNYQALSPPYGSGPYTLLAGSPNSNPAYNQVVNMASWFNGLSGLPSAGYFPSLTEINTNFGTLHQQLGTGLNAQQGPVQFTPDDYSYVKENTETAYVMASFRNDKSSVPFRGNIGLRVIAEKDSAGGSLNTGQSVGAYFAPEYYIAANNYANSATELKYPQTGITQTGGHSGVYVLPSMNIQFLPTPELHLRLAASEGLNRPSFQQLNPQGSLGPTFYNAYSPTWITSVRGDPNLKPETALQLDASAEYYFRKGGEVHLAAFYKKLSNYIGTEGVATSYLLTTPTVLVPGNGVAAGDPNAPQTPPSVTPCPTPTVVGSACPQNLATVDQHYFNETQAASIFGIEAGFQKYADFLPAPFNGLGIDANYTYLNSKQPGARAFDMQGNPINNLPVTGLSKNTFNLQLMYDQGPLSLRVAYNWRSSFLVTTTAYQTSGQYNNLSNVADTTNGTDVIGSGQLIYYALPVFQYGSGQLDANVSYDLNKRLKVVFQVANLTKTTARLYMYLVGNQAVNRSWYTSDRRFNAALRFNF